MQERILTQYNLFKLTDHYWSLPKEKRTEVLDSFIGGQKEFSTSSWLYQVYPAQTEADILIWNNIVADKNDVPNIYFEKSASINNQFRLYFELKRTYWGMTKPSVYSKAKKSEQEIDPFDNNRLPYFIVYPFTKTSDWYLKPREERQEMMNDHMRIGKSYREITQLLLYSFGLQDQEFVVSYETHELGDFSDLVYELRGTQARIYTLNDTPIITGFLRTQEKLVELFS
jgi:chlorite dismutase